MSVTLVSWAASPNVLECLNVACVHLASQRLYSAGRWVRRAEQLAGTPEEWVACETVDEFARFLEEDVDLQRAGGGCA